MMRDDQSGRGANDGGTGRRAVERVPAWQKSASGIALNVPSDANTIVYVHGIGNKPRASVLKCQWDRALFGVDLGERSRMAYWVNRARFPLELVETCGGADLGEGGPESPGESGLGAQARGSSEPDLGEFAGVDPQAAAVLRGVAAAVWRHAATDDDAGGVTAQGTAAKVLPLPRWMRESITRRLTRKLLPDVHDFLFDEEQRTYMKERLRERLLVGGGPFVVIAHSQGSMIAYDVLRELSDSDGVHVPLLVTIGSPLGLDEVQDRLRTFRGGRPLEFPACVTRWVNVAEHLDPVAADPALSNDTESWARIIDVHGLLLNPDAPRHPHSASGYLRSAEVQRWVRAAVGNDFTQAVGRFALARDVVADLEDALPEQRREVLIELRAEGSDADLDRRRKEIQQRLSELVGSSAKDAAIEPLRHFVAASLTRREVETLRDLKDAGVLATVWRDASKSALIDVSTHTVQARPANESYGARGAGIAWAVLDTGVWAGHPHFARYSNVTAQWDCTPQGAPKKWDSKVESRRLDGHGHGTHVAGIIAGWWRSTPAEGAEAVTYAGMAPEAKLHVYKVLGDDGRGRDSWIIKALDHIWTVNEKASELVIHGVNLSLGGAFDPRVYGCGHSPLCRELLRLWRQGVAVVIAAGNEGIMLLQGESELREVSLDVSIGDPANLDEAIAVGSVHKSNPHTYGVSYFSSRGPTADGRPKPDLVAPGERVRSASFRAAASELSPAELYVQMSGTSMAAPHVSGLVAAFLSLRRELIGRPDDVKKILLGNCTGLGRDPLFQGAGIPNLVKMLLST